MAYEKPFPQEIPAAYYSAAVGIGFTMDRDMQLYSRRAEAAALAFGDAHFHREIVAQELGF